ncbi:MAG: DAK2 domain-containing protein [Bacillota bacterium]
MDFKEMNSIQLKHFLCQGSALLEAHKEEVNDLNVFPVPDGDTGTNMFLTISYAVKNIEDAEHHSVGEVMQEFSMGALMGARGNSGVILSQMFRGFGQGVIGKDPLRAADLAAALQKGVDLSYKSVMKPVEGTMLTVFKDFALAAQEYVSSDDDIIGMFEHALTVGEKSLQNTPKLLPVLQEAGVVDAGGKGLLLIFEGGLRYLKGQDLGVKKAPSASKKIVETPVSKADEIKYAYCTEVLIKGNNLDADKIKTRLAKDPEGDSMVVVGMDSVVKIHIHTNDPGDVLKYASSWGSLHDIKIENMRDQYQGLHQEPSFKDEAEKASPEIKEEVNTVPSASAVLAVCTGDGIKEIFKSMGATVLSGGQTMNPSASEIMEAIDQLSASEVIILPNNKNIILAAQQAQKLLEKPVYVVESKFITQGLAAMMEFDPEQTAANNFEAMQEAVSVVKSAELTFAVRQSQFNGIEIHENDILAINEGKIVGSGTELQPTLMEMLEKIIDDDDSVMSLFYGNGLTEEQAQEIVKVIVEKFPHLEIDCHYGGQPLYHFLISIE